MQIDFEITAHIYLGKELLVVIFYSMVIGGKHLENSLARLHIQVQ